MRFATWMFAGACFLSLQACATPQPCISSPAKVSVPAVYVPIAGFDAETNAKLQAFFERHKDTPGRKVAVFDGDGTVFGQTPHYMADECLYRYAAAHPERKPELLAEMGKMVNVSIPYVQGRVRYFAGKELQWQRDQGERCFNEMYADKMYKPMQDLFVNLKAQGFEAWVVTASPEAMYQQFLSKQLGIPIYRVVGIRAVIRGGLVTDTFVQPIPQDHGKKEAIETFIQTQPLLVGGNSRGDKEMIEFASDLRLIVNPDEHVAEDQTESIFDYAKREGWLVVRIRDVPRPDFPSLSSKQFGIRINKTRDVK